eukprot:Plantae.Rhodophyta-Purpureofilum_apyrenoidigerum.ctg3103.p1 GENE.Plantae.Rhodophyta-Purpureofilum_apyrenoidigerum.ctg3103~~Plantae.Rhodophyta-Purpureofilum_apyrenoidigerum.ctg3103.p1  ORF type:complete len:435 (+),score=56.61 Plantae.Rhodophyta-Purpureofilum_apyrenoidigerum.ctg3103:168-1472(+)
MEQGVLPTGTVPRPRLSSSSSDMAGKIGLGTRVVLVTGKVSRVAAVFLSFYYLTSPIFSVHSIATTLPLPMYLFLVTSGAAAFLLAFQRPWQGRPIGKSKIQEVALGGALLALTLYVYSAGLRACGPLRTLLLDGSELPMLYAYGVLTGKDRASSKRTKGVLLVIFAYALVLYDASGRASGDAAALAHTEFGMRAEKALEMIKDEANRELSSLKERQRKYASERSNERSLPVRRLLQVPDVLSQDDLGVGDVDASSSEQDTRSFDMAKPMILLRGRVGIEVGVFLILCASAITLASSGFRKHVAVQIGGAKRSFALTVSMAAATFLPFALLAAFRETARFSLSDVQLSQVTVIMLTGFLWIVLPYYIRANLAQMLSHGTILRAAPINFVLGALVAICTGFGTLAGPVTTPLAAAFIVNVLGLHAVAGIDQKSDD